MKKCTVFGKPFYWKNKPISAAHFYHTHNYRLIANILTNGLALFTKTVNELFTGEKAKEAIWRAGKMAEMFELKIASAKNNPLNIL